MKPKAVVSAFWLVALAMSLPAAERPNILLIFADDLGWRDVGFNGSDFYETPNLDRLAKKGMVFPHAYAGGGNCQPSRACLLSGQYTPRHGVYAVDSTERGSKHLMRMAPGLQAQMQPKFVWPLGKKCLSYQWRRYVTQS